MRRLNLRLGRLSQSEYNWTVKEPVALEVLARRAREEGKARLTRPAYELALRWNAFTREAIEQVRGGGDRRPRGPPDQPRPRAARARCPPSHRTPATPKILDAAEEAAATFARHAKRRRRKLARIGVEVTLVERTPAQSLRATWESAEDPVDAAATDLADRAREDALLLRRIREERLRGARV